MTQTAPDASDLDEMDLADAILFSDSARGQYIPQHFAECIDRSKLHGASDEDMATLEAGPDEDWYWEAWVNVLDNATVIDGGTTYDLWQDGDLWLVPRASTP